ncbi:hypothetical protein L150_02308 [Candida albicans Ca529L]|nr:hypothetical protein L150_02308 [Candida albicans Ca529L]
MHAIINISPFPLFFRWLQYTICFYYQNCYRSK